MVGDDFISAASKQRKLRNPVWLFCPPISTGVTKRRWPRVAHLPLPIVPGVILAEEVFETIRLVVGEPHDSDGFSVAPLPLPHWLVHR